MQTSLKVCIFLLSKADSNHHKQNQNLLCYHYTIGHRLLIKRVQNYEIFGILPNISHFLLLDYQQIVVLLAFLG